MGKLRLASILVALSLGCASTATTYSTGVPENNNEWAERCLRIGEDQYPDKQERFQECTEKWRVWSEAQSPKAR